MKKPLAISYEFLSIYIARKHDNRIDCAIHVNKIPFELFEKLPICVKEFVLY